MPKVVAVCKSVKRGTKKRRTEKALLKKGHGIEGDAHAGAWHRQVSLLAIESIEKVRSGGLEVGPGDFAENITTQGIDLVSLPLGTKLRIGHSVLLEVSQRGKICHTGCDIYRSVGKCTMSEEGIFARVLADGEVKAGDSIAVVYADHL